MNKIVLRFSGDSNEYPCLILGDDVGLNPDDRDNRIEIRDGARPIEARIFMDDAQYNALPAVFKSGPFYYYANSLCAIQITCDDCLELGNVSSGKATRTIQTSYCFFLDKAQIIRSGTDNNIRMLRLLSVQETWKYERQSSSYNHIGSWELNFSTIASTSSLTSRQTILNALFNSILTEMRLGASAPTIPAAEYDSNDFLPPLNFTSSGYSVRDGIIRLLEPYCQQLIYNPWVAALGDAGTFSVVNLKPTDTNQANVIDLLEACRVNGMTSLSESEPWGAWYSPYYVRFRTANEHFDSDNNAIADASYTTIEPGGTYNYAEHVFNGEYTLDGECKTRYTNQIAKAIYDRSQIKPRIYMASGAYPLCAGNAFREVIISVGSGGIITTIRQHGKESASGEDSKVLTADKIHQCSAMGTVVKRRMDGHIDIYGGYISGVFAVKLIHVGAGLYDVCIAASGSASANIPTTGAKSAVASSYALDNTSATTLTFGLAYYDYSGSGTLHVIGLY